MRHFRVALLAPLLVVGLLFPSGALPVDASVSACSAGGSITVYPSGNVGGVALSISCKQNYVATTSIPGATSTQTFWPGPPANASWNGAYCAGSANGIDQTRWDPISVSRSGNTYTLHNSSSPYAPNTRRYISFFPGGAINATEQIPSYIPATGNAGASGQGFNIVLAGDSTADAWMQNAITSGPIYYRWDRTGATWQNGADPINNYAYHWVYSYTDTPFQWTTAGPTFTTWVNNSINVAPPTYTSKATTTTQTIVARTGTSETIVTKKSWYVITYSISVGRANTLETSTRTDYETDTNVHYTWTRYLASVTPGRAPSCQGGTWNNITGPGPASISSDGPAIWIWPGAIKISSPASYVAIPASWVSLANLTANVKPGTFSQVLGNPNIQAVGVPFPYAVKNQSYSAGSFSGACSITPASTQQCVLGPLGITDPTTGVEFFVTLVSDVGLVGVKWDWGDPASTASPQVPTPGDQSLYSPAVGLGNCSPAPFCGPTHTPTRIGNYKINVFEYYGSSIWAYYYDSAQGGVVAVNLGTGLPGYTGCKDARGVANDPNPSVRPSGSSFCLSPTPASPGSAEVIANGLQVGGYPYNVGQIEGLPGS